MELLAACAEGKNVYTEIKCTSLLPLEDVVRVVTHEDCITEVAPPQQSVGARRPGVHPSALCPGEGGVRQLCQPLLRGHRGGDEGNLHVQPHLEAV